ncbi:MAG: S41 family peptidase [Lactobacillaceae bacterium]|jgi:carboxyl-terminal processing protease|nr:S41 family peptidase [Lactobacillaceae bacterium]
MFRRTLVAVTCLLTFVMTSSCASAGTNAAEKEINAETYELLNLFGEVLERSRNSYVEDVTDKKLIEAAINGMLTSLDPHSSFLDEKSFKQMTEQTKGKFGGLGIEVTMENGLVKVVSPIDDTPAFKAGLKPGDYIIEIDGEPVMGLTLNEAVEKMRGKPGTKIKLKISRAGEKPFDVTLKREEIKIQSVKSEVLDNDVLYVRVTSFNEETDKMVRKAVEKTKDELKKDLKGIVIDVRNNPGGLLDQAISVSDLFIDKGEIVSTRSRNEEDTIKYTAEPGDIAEGLPIVVIINDGSASASEIVAGALQDHKRAIVLGEKSFGKGSVQTVIPLGRTIAMRITTARYYTPSGRSIQAKGIEPDITVKPSKVEVIDKYSFSEAGLKNALKNDEVKQEKQEKDNGKAKISEDEALAKKERIEKDYQLSRAIDLVKALKIYNAGE